MDTLTWHFNCNVKHPHEPEFATETVDGDGSAWKKSSALKTTVYVNWHDKKNRFLYKWDGQGAVKQGPWEENQ